MTKQRSKSVNMIVKYMQEKMKWPHAPLDLKNTFVAVVLNNYHESNRQVKLNSVYS